ncbi:10817_t:CDS:2 [Diversispora eburnea]|uniref:10817_t:CDS:1 n=1 Tax=Diversispora eburnea TaxID=1213867 RepID=A0A9N9BJY2_9GLOM|nr:10817_t:CDS:2 [Diversispora eburnea]
MSKYVLIFSLSVNSNWNNIDHAWSANFLNEAKNLLDQENFADLKEKPIVNTINREGDEIGEYDYNNLQPSRHSVVPSPYLSLSNNFPSPPPTPSRSESSPV